MSPDAADDLPHDSDEPAWSDTWCITAVDPSSRRAIVVHVAWRPALGSGTHFLGICGDDEPVASRTATTEPLASRLLGLDVDPWRSFRIRAPEHGVDLRWDALHDAVDFRRLLDIGPTFRQAHLEAGGRVHGTVARSPFEGVGHRDRSFGPRDMGALGRHVWVVLTGCEREVSVSLAMIRPAGAPADGAPAATFGYCFVDGQTTPITSGVVTRTLDARPAAFELGGRACAVTEVVGDVTLPGPDLAQGWSYRDVQTFLVAESPTLGRLAGLHEDGSLVAF